MKREPAKKSPYARKTEAPRNEASRPVRVAAQLRQEIARLLNRDYSDPRLENLVVTSAWISSDLHIAKIFFRLATTSENAALEALKKDAQKALEGATGRLRKAVTAHLQLRIAPELKFVYDDGQDARSRIEVLLDEVKREPKAPVEPGDPVDPK